MSDFFISRYPTHYEVMPDGGVRFIYPKEGSMKDWMQFGEGVFDFGTMKFSGDVRPFHIAHALSLLNRFTGHSHLPYSVAQHSCYVSDLLYDGGKKPLLALHGLVHDLHEAVMGDWSTPLQNSLSPAAREELAGLQYQVQDALLTLLGIPCHPSTDMCGKVMVADLQALAAEKRDIMPHGGPPWRLPYPPADPIVRPSLNPQEDEIQWLTRLRRLMVEVGFNLPSERSAR